jgi:hypothetical protein
LSEDEDISINYEVIRNQRFMIENARYFIREVDPWKTTKNDLDEETCITVEEFNKWKRHLLKILGVATDE